jgi:hypothetical protein
MQYILDPLPGIDEEDTRCSVAEREELNSIQL